jgi:flagellar basal body-associated protein FliL
MEVQMKDNRIIVVGVIVLVLIVGVVIVFVGGKGPGSEVVIVPTESVVQADVSQAQEQPPTEIAESVDPTATAEINTPAPKTELSATDPSSVNLTSGDIQLVEAFAFW